MANKAPKNTSPPKLGVIGEDPTDCEAIRVIARAIHPTLKVHKHGKKGCTKIPKKAKAWMRNFARKGCKYVVIVHDLDRNKEHMLRKKLERIEVPPGIERHICIPAEELKRTDTEVLYATKSIENSPIMWPKPMDVITFKRVDANGNANGCCVITGFFTSRAESTDLDSIPLLRHKSLNTVARSKINPGAHDGKILLSTLESFPRDMLLQSDEDTIMTISRGIMNLLHHPRVRLFGIQDRFNRFATCFVYVPSDIYSRQLRHRIQEILLNRLNADNVEFDITLSSENTLARLHFFLRTPHSTGNREADFPAIEQAIIDVAQDWDDNLRDALFASMENTEDKTTDEYDSYRVDFSVNNQTEGSVYTLSGFSDTATVHVLRQADSQ